MCMFKKRGGIVGGGGTNKTQFNAAFIALFNISILSEMRIR